MDDRDAFQHEAKKQAVFALSLGLRGVWAELVWREHMEIAGWHVICGKVHISGKVGAPQLVIENLKFFKRIKYLATN